MKKYVEKLKKLNACQDAIEYSEKFSTLQKAWNECNRGDWMLWLLGRLSGPPDSESRKHVVLIACKCARLSLKYIPKDEKRPLEAIQTTEKYSNGKATFEEVKKAFAAATAAFAASTASDSAAASASATAFAASTAAFAASTASDSAAASATAFAASATASAAASATAASVKEDILKKCSNIVRKYHPIMKINNYTHNENK